LRHERVLAEPTITYYVTFVREFLTDRFGRGRVTLARLCARDVVRFVRRQASRLHLKRAKQLTTALRAFLRYARYRGDITQDLVAAVPAVANWSMPSIPRAIPAESVHRLLASITRQTARGRRDYAILLLLARLGLRASEVACLELDDLDWEGGQVTVRGKRGARAALPLPADVGEAIAAYLRHGRPRSSCRRLFLRARALTSASFLSCLTSIAHAHQRAWRVDATVRGWMGYYGAFHRSALYPLLHRINTYLLRWIMAKYRTLRSWKKALRAMRDAIRRQPRYFAHWAWVKPLDR
jgi:site-specific recombinase XerD